MKKNIKIVKLSFFEKIVWFIISIIEWTSIPLYMAAMGYKINFDVYIAIKNWEYIQYLFYTLSGIAAIGFLYFSIKFAILKLKKEKLIAEISCIVQLLLIILKLKI